MRSVIDGQRGDKMAYILEEYTPQGDGQVALWASKPSVMELEAVVNNRLELFGVHKTIGFIKSVKLSTGVTVKIGDIGYSLIKG